MFFFGFLSSMLPYVATLVVMALYILIGSPNKEELSLNELSQHITLEEDAQSTSYSVASFDYVYAEVSESTFKPKHSFELKKKLKIHSLTAEHYKSLFSSALSNKAPPVQA